MSEEGGKDAAAAAAPSRKGLSIAALAASAASAATSGATAAPPLPPPPPTAADPRPRADLPGGARAAARGGSSALRAFFSDSEAAEGPLRAGEAFAAASRACHEAAPLAATPKTSGAASDAKRARPHCARAASAIAAASAIVTPGAPGSGGAAARTD